MDTVPTPTGTWNGSKINGVWVILLVSLAHPHAPGARMGVWRIVCAQTRRNRGARHSSTIERLVSGSPLKTAHGNGGNGGNGGGYGAGAARKGLELDVQDAGVWALVAAYGGAALRDVRGVVGLLW